MKPLSQRRIILLIVIACFVSRLPQLLSDKLILDGDECVVAIMAKHIYVLKDFPLFFYGQQYGFSLIECLFIIPFYAVFGITTIAVKLGMLALWTIGVIFLYKTLAVLNRKSEVIPVLLIGVFIMSPAWAVWSMKARGGYLTSFCASSIILYLLFLERTKWYVPVLAGTLLCIVYESQPIWMPGLAPFILYAIVRARRVKPAILFIIPFAALTPVFYFYRRTLPDFGKFPSFTPSGLDTFRRIPNFLYVSLHGNYFFDDVQKPNFFCVFIAVLMSIMIFSLPVIAVYTLIKRKPGSYLLAAAVLSVILTLLVSLFSQGLQGRYLLPVSGFTFIALALFINLLKDKPGFFKVAALPVMAMGMIALITFRDFTFDNVLEWQLRGMLQYLDKNDIRYAYCNDNMFTWQVIFYSNERVFAREHNLPGRYPEYSEKADSALNHHIRTAFIAKEGEVFAFKNFIVINSYSVAFDPQKDLLAAARFHLRE